VIVVTILLGWKGIHLEGARTMRINGHGAADTILSHQGAQAREQRRKLLWSRMRAREQRVLHDAARGRVDDDRHAIDCSGRRVRFEIEQQERAQRSRITNGRRQLQMTIVLASLCRVSVEHSRKNKPKVKVQNRGAPIPAFELRGQRLEQPRQHKRQRFEAVDRPFKIKRRFKPLLGTCRDKRRRLLAPRDGLPGQRALAKP
jgi:hypothetical protein